MRGTGTAPLLATLLLCGLGAAAAVAQDFREREIFVTYGEGVYATGLTLGQLARVFRENHEGNEASWVARGPAEQLLSVVNIDPLTKERRKMAFLFRLGAHGAVVQRLATGLHEASEREIYITLMEIAATVRAREQAGAAPP